MRHQGRIIKWYDDKGFGFVLATADSKDVFLHISEIHKLNRRPEINELVTYEITRDEKGRFRAVNVGYVSGQEGSKKPSSSTSFSFIFLTFILLFAVFVLELTLKGFLPHFYFFVYLGANLFVFLYYYQDKTSAMKNNWRTEESKLHWLSLLGGRGALILRRSYLDINIKKHRLCLRIN